MTPLQMAMVAGTIGNDGILMRPFVVEKTVTPNGKTRDPDLPDEDPPCRDACDGAGRRRHDGARRSGRYRHGRADPGLARSAARRERPRPGVDGRNVTWFIAFAGEDGKKPKLAIAVVLQNQSLTGGATAAPIARQVMQALLTPTANP